MFVGHEFAAAALGVACARLAGRDRRTALAVGTLAGVVALLPDLDLAVGAVAYLRTLGGSGVSWDGFWAVSNGLHRGVLHTLLGGLVGAAALTAVAAGRRALGDAVRGPLAASDGGRPERRAAATHSDTAVTRTTVTTGKPGTTRTVLTLAGSLALGAGAAFVGQRLAAVGDPRSVLLVGVGTVAVGWLAATRDPLAVAESVVGSVGDAERATTTDGERAHSRHDPDGRLPLRWVAAAALVGFCSHPFGDLFLAAPPRVFYPASLFDGPVRFLADPTLNLLAVTCVELTAVWAGVLAYAHATRRSVARAVRPTAAAGVAYPLVTLLVPRPTMAAAHWLGVTLVPFAALVGSFGFRTTASDRASAASDGVPTAADGRLAAADRAFRAVVTGLAACSLAVAAYAGWYVLG